MAPKSIMPTRTVEAKAKTTNASEAKVSKLKIHSKIGFKLVDLDVEYNFTLAKVGVNLVALANEL